jgi:molybdenum cofactor cytidylyltransferase
MGRVCAESLITAGLTVGVVIRAGDTATARLFGGIDTILIESANAHLGMGHSIADAVAMTRTASGWLIALADMPFVQTATVTSLLSRAATSHSPAICRPRHEGRPGHPVWFSRQFGDELLQLRGDEGAKALLHRHAALVQWLDVDDEGVTQDIDYRLPT